MDSDEEKTTSDSDYGIDEDSAEIVEKDINRFKNYIDSNMPLWKRIETKENKSAIEQGKKVATYDDKLAKDIYPL